MRQCTSVTDRWTDRRTMASQHKREMYILHLALKTAANCLHKLSVTVKCQYLVTRVSLEAPGGRGNVSVQPSSCCSVSLQDKTSRRVIGISGICVVIGLTRCMWIRISPSTKLPLLSCHCHTHTTYTYQFIIIIIIMWFVRWRQTMDATDLMSRLHACQFSVLW